jgi:hypothetical protein
VALRRADRERGQASIEHVAVVLLVALVLGGAVTAADALGARSGIGDVVRRQFARAICVVGGGGTTCDADREPCLVRSDTERNGYSLQLAIFRYSKTKSVVVEQLSDDTFHVTQVDEREGGLSIADGARFNLDIGRRHVRIGREAEAEISGRLADGDSWTLRGRGEVNALVEALRHGRPHRAPDARSEERGWSVKLGGTLSGPARSSASLTISASDVYGSRLDRATGRRTIYVRPSREIEGKLTFAALEGKAGAGGTELYAVTVERDGTPVELSVMRAGSYAGSMDLPRSIQPAAGLLGVRSPRAAREYAVETRLALNDDADRRLAATFIDQVLHPDVVHTGSPVEISRALDDRLEAAGVMNARTYAVDEGGFAIDARVGVRGVPAGGGIEHDKRHTARLIAAASRGPDGIWYRRDDCMRAGQRRV